MDDQSTNLDLQESARKFNAEILGELFRLLDIKQAYYIDDYNKIDVLPYIISTAKQMFESGESDKLFEIFLEKVIVNVPDDDALVQNINQGWEILDEAEKKAIASQLLIEGTGFNPRDYFRTRELQQSFPDKYLTLISPDEWDDVSQALAVKYKKGGKVLILFDQDLKHADGDKFKSGAEQGQHLILAVKKSSLKKRAYCVLITHLITDTSQELIERNNIIQGLNKAITEKDFFALSKERIKSPDLLCDGIKKALLNGYCEEIKRHSKKIIKNAQKEALTKVIALDTYDFDHTVLRSSYNEGVWEINTLFRISENFYIDAVKSMMEKSKYSKKVNPFIKDAKLISDVRFNIEPGTIPYEQKYLLRHQDIYENDIINKLHLPLENGDIFQVFEGKEKGFYILVGQECDLMMRTDPLGSRSGETATLLRIKDFTRKQLEELIIKYTISNSDTHFFSNKFRLDYFKKEKNDVGLVKFSESYIVYLDVLDMCVFSKDGLVTLDLNSSFDFDLLSTAWGSRYQKIIAKFKKEADLLDKLLLEVNNLANEIKLPVKKRLLPKVSSVNDLGKSDTYSDRKFDFGIKRIMRFKSDGAKYLLDRYYKHLARVAEQHDFAFEKIIKEGAKAVADDRQNNVDGKKNMTP